MGRINHNNLNITLICLVIRTVLSFVVTYVCLPALPTFFEDFPIAKPA